MCKRINGKCFNVGCRHHMIEFVNRKFTSLSDDDIVDLVAQMDNTCVFEIIEKNQDGIKISKLIEITGIPERTLKRILAEAPKKIKKIWHH